MFYWSRTANEIKSISFVDCKMSKHNSIKAVTTKFCPYLSYRDLIFQPVQQYIVYFFYCGDLLGNNIKIKLKNNEHIGNTHLYFSSISARVKGLAFCISSTAQLALK